MTASQTDCIDVAVALPVHQTYTYRVPDSLNRSIAVGKRVLVPFGRRRVTGYVLDYVACRNTVHKLKNILDILDDGPLFSADMLPFFRWIADYYLHPLGEVIKNALPGGLTASDAAQFTITAEGEAFFENVRINPLEKKVLTTLRAGSLHAKALDRALGESVPRSLLQSLKSRKLIQTERVLKMARTKPKWERMVTVHSPEIPQDRYYEVRQKLIAAIQAEGEIALPQLKKRVPEAKGSIAYLVRNGYLTIHKKPIYRDPFGESISPDSPLPLTGEQEAVVQTVKHQLGQGFKSYLLSGVTGSGKTEVYMQAAQAAIGQGYAVLVLVPEIALISQTERRFRARFGDCVALLHSNLTAGERYDQWQRIVRNEAQIVIGARSAIFAPLQRIGLIIVDEEHDSSYKQDTKLHYNARDLAIVRAKLNDCVAVMGSATPSMQSVYNVTLGKYSELTLRHRINQRPLPKVTIIDLKDFRDARGSRRFITPPLFAALKEKIALGEQTLLFLNRRGFASYPVCVLCGEPVKCNHCDITLTLHKQIKAFKCHFCGFTKVVESVCQNCGSPHFKLMGLGTERIEQDLQLMLPEARVARLDRDTTSHKGALLKILRSLRRQEIDILIGTQMLAKGHDFPNITLVGILCADLSLNFPDFRACEQTFQVLAQVAGRAGRGTTAGEVILQTYNPAHYSIVAAQKQDYQDFYEKEIAFRKSLNYPPFSRMAQLKITGKDKQKTEQHALAVGEMIRQWLAQWPEYAHTIEMLGPVEAPITRIANYFRWQIIFKTTQLSHLQHVLQTIMLKNTSLINHSHVRVVLDMDPFFMM